MGSHKLTTGNSEQTFDKFRKNLEDLLAAQCGECQRESQRQPQGGWDAICQGEPVEGKMFSGVSSRAPFGHLILSFELGLTM